MILERLGRRAHAQDLAVLVKVEQVGGRKSQAGN